MEDISIQAAVVQQDSWMQKQPEDIAAAQKANVTDGESQSLVNMIKDAQDQVEAHRNALNVPKTGNTRYGDAPLEAYARLMRAKSVSEVNAVSGYARRSIAQLKSSLHVDSENAAKIKAAISQLQKAVGRAEKKKRAITREKQAEQRRARSKEAQERMEFEIRRRRAQRTVQESGYLREAQISDQLATQLTAAQVELRQQAQSLSIDTAAVIDIAVQQYTGTVAEAAAALTPSAEISMYG